MCPLQRNVEALFQVIMRGNGDIDIEEGHNMYFFFLGVKCSNQVEKCCFNFHDALYCCVKYSNVECQDEIFKLLIKSNVQKQNY